MQKKDNSKAAAGYLCIGSVTLAYALSVRPSLIFLPFAYIIGLVFVEVCRKNYRSIVPIILVISVVCYIPVYAWTVRNKNVADYNGYSTVSSINLYCYNAAAVYTEQNDMKYNDTVTFLKQGKDERYQEYLESMDKYEAMDLRAKEIIASDVPAYMKRCMLDMAFLEVYPGVLSVSDR